MVRRVCVLTLVVVLLTGCGGRGVAAAPDVTVIDVTGLPYADARAELRAMGLDVRRTERAARADQGIVLAQDLAPGARVAAATSIVLTVSGGAAEPSEETPPTWSRTYRRISDGVVRIKATMCEGTATGSGFLVASDLVATNAHVVSGSVNITVDADGDVRAGQIVGIDEARDLALIKIDAAVDGHVFDPVTQMPDVGADVAAVGYPLGGSLSLATGTVSGLDRQVGPIARAIQTDAAVNPGNSGGPLLDLDGRVVGVIVAAGRYEDYEADQVVVRDAEGLAFAIPSNLAFPTLLGWRDDRPGTVTQACAPREPQIGPSTVTPAGPLASAVAATLDRYATGINTGDYAAAYAQWSPHMQQGMSYDTFVDEHMSSLLYDIEVLDVLQRSADELAADVEFWSEQDPVYGPQGQSCSVWSLTYRMVRDGDRWLIDGAQHNLPDSPSPCEWAMGG